MLLYTIDKINSLNNNIEIELESNGIYFYNNTFEKLSDFNNKITSIRFSDDPFHEAGGVNLSKVRKLKKYQDKLTYNIKYLIQDKALSIGNAKKLDNKFIKKGNCMNTEKTKENPYFFLDIEGNIYLCSWKMINPIGNIFIDKMNAILARLKENFNEKILTGKIEEAFTLNNKSLKDNIEYTKKYGQCMLCEYYKNVL